MENLKLSTTQSKNLNFLKAFLIALVLVVIVQLVSSFSQRIEEKSAFCDQAQKENVELNNNNKFIKG